MKLVSLASGSSGNAFLVDSGDGLLLLDVGITYKTLRTELAELGRSPEEIRAVLLTHEHADHISGLPVWMKHHPDVPVFASYGTFEGLSRQPVFLRLRKEAFELIRPHERVSAAGLELLPVPTSHDTPGSLAWRGGREDSSFAVITDLGCWTEDLARDMEGLSVICLEANHDMHMLETGPYPYPLKLRIESSSGHLSNDDAAALLIRLWHGGLKEVILAHLSRENNYPDLAVQTVISELKIRGIDPASVPITAAPRTGLSHIVSF